MLPAPEASPAEVFRALLERRVSLFGLALPAACLERLARFLTELDRARRRTNLTGPLTAAQLVDHVFESALGERLIPHGAEVVDIGSGAGFPGIPLAVVRADLRVRALEPRRKRADFLRHVMESVPVSNAFVFEGRPKDLVNDVWDVATARAVGSIDRILGDAPFLKENGLFLAWTTDAGGLARRLPRCFSIETTLPVPQSRQKVIAAFRKRVPRGTLPPRERRTNPG